MEKKIGRRSFLAKGAALGAMSLLGQSVISAVDLGGKTLFAAEKVDLSVVKGRNYYKNTMRAVSQLGGMKQFVSRGSNVGLLVNSPFKNYGAHAKPEIVLAAITMCYEAGAKEIRVLKEEFDGYWKRSSLYSDFTDEIASLKPAWDNKVSMDIKDGISLKDATVCRELLECDVLINISITKDHMGTNFSCILKNMMGAASTSTNLSFHVPFNNVKKLSQRIADLNLLRKPDLCIADATEFISTKGPYGPGKILSPKTIVAGVDRVAVDSYVCRFLGLDAKDIQMIQFAHQHGMGNYKLDETKILETKA